MPFDLGSIQSIPKKRFSFIRTYIRLTNIAGLLQHFQLHYMNYLYIFLSVYKRPTNTKKEKECLIRKFVTLVFCIPSLHFFFLDLVHIFSCLIILPIVLGSMFITAYGLLSYIFSDVRRTVSVILFQLN